MASPVGVQQLVVSSPMTGSCPVPRNSTRSVKYLSIAVCYAIMDYIPLVEAVWSDWGVS